MSVLPTLFSSSCNQPFPQGARIYDCGSSTIIGSGDGSVYGSSLSNAAIELAGVPQKKQRVKRVVDTVGAP